ncbi:MAG TPA: metal-dependent hydrolase [Kofleriaceae bacterium]|nr:metal-dependent hydrolase [Kofleriaceae bacterium]
MQLIPRRHVDLALDPAAVPRDWCASDPYVTTYNAALSLLFPEGEQFFVQSVKQLAAAADSPALQQQIAGFIGQEAMHGKEHRAFNDLLVAHGYPEAPRIEARLRRFLRGVRRALPARSQLAVTCALEHFTAMLAELLLGNRQVQEEFDPSVRALWLWHAYEESEHKAVAFDLYRAAGGGYVRRCGMMLVTTFVFVAVHAIVHARLMATRGILWRPWTWLRGIGRMWIYPGYFVRQVPAYLAYFRPSFHPDDRDTRPLLAAWHAQLFADDGLLAGRVRA